MPNFTTHPVFVLAILIAIIAISEWLAERPLFKRLGTALLVIILGAVAANIGLIPTASNAIPLYDSIFTYVAPLSIFYVLLQVNLKSLRQAGMPMLIIFLVGSFATAIGVIVANYLVLDEQLLGELRGPLAGMFTGTYTGGSVNFNAVALHYEVQKEGNIYAAAVAVDNIFTTVYMLLCLAIPLWLQNWKPRSLTKSNVTSTAVETSPDAAATMTLSGLSWLAAIGLFALFFSIQLAEWLDGFGWHVAPILIITTLALLLAQIPKIANLGGSQLIGMLMIYLFLVVIGAFCELSAVSTMGAVAINLFFFIIILVSIHALIIFGIGGLLGYDWYLISIASQANVGGSTTALALAKTFGRNELVIPGFLVGALGNAVGTYLGFAVAAFLSS
ncbi:MAG: DUF819 domain-containing protein [Saprospiraceae bacterium]